MTRLIANINRSRVLAFSIGFIYVWFGVLKFFPQLSPADALAKQTITFLTFGILPESISIFLLAILEVVIGMFLIFNFQLRKIVVVAIFHLILTFVPLLFFANISFDRAPFVPSLVGQYIMKNIVIISALLLVYPGDEATKLQQS
ncbi:doxx family protein [Zhouia amylolytica]|uniref:doxx family protein n=1 Tax=Zhouia amylolytica TaxID=376730 RepID=UPI0020CEC67D|nr:doxx family protein [Zhouia amylolytica]MCQ0110892.1 doxx family protein [Zhouia amylolytica]